MPPPPAPPARVPSGYALQSSVSAPSYPPPTTASTTTGSAPNSPPARPTGPPSKPPTTADNTNLTASQSPTGSPVMRPNNTGAALQNRPSAPPPSNASANQWPTGNPDDSDLASSQYAPSSRVFTSSFSEGGKVAPPERIPNTRRPGGAPAVPTSRPNTPRDTDNLSHSQSFSGPSRPPPTVGTLSSNPSFSRPTAPPSGPPSKFSAQTTTSPPPIRPPPVASVTSVPPSTQDDLASSNPTRSGTFAPPPNTRPQGAPISGTSQSSAGSAPSKLQLSGDEGATSTYSSGAFVAPNSSFVTASNQYGGTSFVGSDRSDSPPNTAGGSYASGGAVAPPAARPTSLPSPPQQHLNRTTPTTMNVAPSVRTQVPPPPPQIPASTQPQRAPSVVFAEENNRTTYIDNSSSSASAVSSAPISITRPNRSGYEEALRSAAVVSTPKETKASSSAAPLYSPSRANFTSLRPIERRSVQENFNAPPPKCEKLFTYEEPRVYGASNREILAWNPSATQQQPNPSETKIIDRTQPAPVGTTLYDGDYTSIRAAAHQLPAGGRPSRSEEPYEGRNELVRQLREYERRKEVAEGLRSESQNLYETGYYQQPTFQPQPYENDSSSLPMHNHQHQQYQFQQYNPQSQPHHTIPSLTPGSDTNYGNPVHAASMYTGYHTGYGGASPASISNDGYVASPGPRASATSAAKGHYYSKNQQQPPEKIIRSYPSDWRVGSNDIARSGSRTPY